MEVIHVLPDTAESVLNLFSVNKEGIKSMINQATNVVANGNVSALDIDLQCAAAIATAEGIRKAIKPYVITEAAKWGDKPFTYKGAELHLTSVYTSYDYSNCNYSDYNKFSKEIADLKEKLKECETFLRGLRAPIEILNNETGEVEIVSPPIKSVTEGLKVSIK